MYNLNNQQTIPQSIYYNNKVRVNYHNLIVYYIGQTSLLF